MKNRLYTIHQRRPLRTLRPLVAKGTPFRERIVREIQTKLHELASAEERQVRRQFEAEGWKLYECTFWSSWKGHLPIGFGTVAADDPETARLVALGLSMDGIIVPGDTLNCGAGHTVTVRWRGPLRKRRR